METGISYYGRWRRCQRTLQEASLALLDVPGVLGSIAKLDVPEVLGAICSEASLALLDVPKVLGARLLISEGTCTQLIVLGARSLISEGAYTVAASLGGGGGSTGGCGGQDGSGGCTCGVMVSPCMCCCRTSSWSRITWKEWRSIKREQCAYLGSEEKASVYMDFVVFPLTF